MVELSKKESIKFVKKMIQKETQPINKRDKKMAENIKKNISLLETGAHREEKEGKGRCDLLQPRALLRISKRLELGAKKYSANDWKVGIPFSMLLDSSIRHLLQYMSKENDENHLDAAITNLLQLLEQEELINEGKLDKRLKDL
jgi:hypothetical protein